jgi:hypothetical protein
MFTFNSKICLSPITADPSLQVFRCEKHLYLFVEISFMKLSIIPFTEIGAPYHLCLTQMSCKVHIPV